MPLNVGERAIQDRAEPGVGSAITHRRRAAKVIGDEVHLDPPAQDDGEQSDDAEHNEDCQEQVHLFSAFLAAARLR